jgi:uncharacterized protein (DUF849 family)
MAKPTIITAAITGSIHTPSMSPYLPYRPEDIVAQAIEAAEHGAAILHLHVRHPEDGRPSFDPVLFQRVVSEIEARTDAVINVTTGGSAVMSLDERLAAARLIRPEMCSLNMGTMNFALHPLAEKDRTWLFDWEKPFLERSKAGIFRNTFADIEDVAVELGDGHGVRFEFECYDVGHLYNLAFLADRGVLKPPFFIQLCFNILGGIGGSVENMTHMKRVADQLFAQNYEWSVLGGGREQFRLCTVAAIMGGNVRVGLEDNLWRGPGRLAVSNAENVTHIRNLIEALDLSIETPSGARNRLALRGRNHVHG